MSNYIVFTKSGHDITISKEVAIELQKAIEQEAQYLSINSISDGKVTVPIPDILKIQKNEALPPPPKYLICLKSGYNISVSEATATSIKSYLSSNEQHWVNFISYGPKASIIKLSEIAAIINEEHLL